MNSTENTNIKIDLDNIQPKDLLDAGIHFGHEKTKWNPKMKSYIHSSRKGVHVINIFKTLLSEIRQILADSGSREFDSLFKALYDNIDKFTTKIGPAILIIAKYQYEYTFVLEKEICVAAMLNELLSLK